MATAQPTTDCAIRCRDLRKRYPARPAPVDAVNGLSLEIRTGECFGLLGPNGAGKTTTIEIFQGLLEPTSGEVEVLGQRWGQDDDALRQRIGTSLQETQLPDRLRVIELARLFCSFYHRGPTPAEILERVGLTEKATAHYEKLSGGQKQRLALACALAGEPDLMFLDEPTTGLDPQSRRHVWDIVRSFRARAVTVLLTTHYMEEAERLCDRVGVVDKGQLIALGTPKELIASLGGEHVIDVALEGDAPFPDDAWHGVPTATATRREADGWIVTVAEPHRAIPGLLDVVARHGRALARLTTRHATLEDVFVRLTGRHLRDDSTPSN